MEQTPIQPAPVTPRRGAIRRRHWVVPTVLAALVLLVGSGLFGGAFGVRGDAVLARSPGEEIDAGNLVFSFNSGTLQRRVRGAEQTWLVRVQGTVRNPHTESLAPLTGERGNLLFAPQGGEPVYPVSGGPFRIGGVAFRDQVQPHNRPVALDVLFELSQGFQPPQEPLAGRVGVSVMEFTDNSLFGLGGDQKRWNIDSTTSAYGVPLTLQRLPDLVE